MGYKPRSELITSMPLGYQVRDFIESVHDNIVRVTAKGAKGDGVTDDTAAFQAAAEEAGQNGTIIVPIGDFRLSGAVELQNGASLIGCGPASRITWTTALDRGITNADRTNGNSNIYIGHLRLDGADLCNDPIELVKCTDCIIDHIWATQGNHDGIELQECIQCIVANSIAHDSNTFNGFEFDSCTDCTLANCIAYNNIFGVEIDGTSDGCLITGGIVRDNTTRGVSFSANTANNVLMGTHLKDNTSDVVDGGTDNSVLWSRGSNLHIANSNYKAGYLFQPCPASAVTDGNISPNRFAVHLDEAGNELTFRVKYSDSSLKTGTVSLS